MTTHGPGCLGCEMFHRDRAHIRIRKIGPLHLGTLRAFGALRYWTLSRTSHGAARKIDRFRWELHH